MSTRMKTFVMKLSALGIFLLAGLVIAYQIRVPAAQDLATFWWDTALPKINGRVGLEWFYVVLALLVMGIAFWALVPRGLSRPAYIRVQGAQGPLVIDLPPLRRRLKKALRKLPGVRKLKLRLKPGKGRQFALLDAEVTLAEVRDNSLHAAADTITDQIATAAQTLLGMRDLVRVHVHIVDVQMEPGATVERLQAATAPKSAPPVADTIRHPVLTPLAETPVVPLTPAAAPEEIAPPRRSPLSLVEEYNPQDPPTFEEEVEDGDYEEDRDVPIALIRSSKLLEQLETSPASAASPLPEALPTAEEVSQDPDDDGMDDDPRAG
jgi:hypothetical protein